MAEQQLDGAHIGAGFQQMYGKRMTQRLLRLPMNQARPQRPFTTVTIRFTANP
ncbi:MAG: hypothetical protein ACREUP_02660 [Burkholderiales bacterium]